MNHLSLEQLRWDFELPFFLGQLLEYFQSLAPRWSSFGPQHFMKPPICPRKHMVPPEFGPKTWSWKNKETSNLQPSCLGGKKGTLKSQFPWAITHLPGQTHNSPRIEAQNLVAQGTWEIEIFNQLTPRKKGFESSNQGAPIKGWGASRRLGFSPGDKGPECQGKLGWDREGD
jgi:hypothetical protein